MSFLMGKADDHKFLKEPVRISGHVWKRRGGMGKLGIGSNAWEMRRMVLRGSTLLYYDDPSSEGAHKDKVEGTVEKRMAAASNWFRESANSINAALSSPTNANSVASPSGGNNVNSNPRGILDLVEEKAIVHTSVGHPGEPSPFCINISSQKIPGVTEPKWRLCFNDSLNQMKWLAAISDVVVKCSVDDYNVQLLQAANPNHPSHNENAPALFRPPPVYEPGSNEQSKVGGGVDQSCHRLWMTDEYTINSPSSLQQVEKNKEQEQQQVQNQQQPEKDEISRVPSNESLGSPTAKRLMEENHKQYIKILRESHEQETQRLKEESAHKLKLAEEKIELLERSVKELREQIATSSTNPPNSNTLPVAQQSTADKEKEDQIRLENLRTSLISTHTKEIEIMQTEKERMRMSLGKTIQSLEDELTSQKQHQQQDKEQRDLAHKVELADLRSSLIATKNQELDSARVEKESICKSLEGTIQSLKDDLVQHQRDKEQQEATSKAALDKLNETLSIRHEDEKEIMHMERERMRKTMEATIQSLKDELVAQKQQQQEDKEKQLEAKTTEAENMRSNLVSSHKEEKDAIMAEKEIMRLSMEDTIQGLKEELLKQQQDKEQKEEVAKTESDSLHTSLIATHKKEKEAILAEKESMCKRMEETIHSLRDELLQKQQQYGEEKQVHTVELDNLRTSLTATHNEELERLSVEKENLRIAMEEKAISLKAEYSQRQLEKEKEQKEATKTELEILRTNLIATYKEEKESLTAEKQDIQKKMEESIQSLKDELVKKEQHYDKEQHGNKVALDTLRTTLIVTHKEEQKRLLAEQERMRVCMEETIQSLRDDLLSAEKIHQDSLQFLKEEFEQKLDNQREKNKDSTKTRTIEIQDIDKETLQQRLKESEAKIKEVNAEKDQFRAATEEKVKALQNSISTIEQIHKDTIESLESDYKDKLDAQTKEINVSVVTPLSKSLQQKEKQVITLRREKEEMRVSMEEKINFLQRELLLTLEEREKQQLIGGSSINRSQVEQSPSLPIFTAASPSSIGNDEYGGPPGKKETEEGSDDDDEFEECLSFEES